MNDAPARRIAPVLRLAAVAGVLLAVTGCGVRTGADIVQGDRQAALARETRSRQDAATVASRRAALPTRPAGVLSVTSRIKTSMTGRAVARLQQSQSPSTYDLRITGPDAAFEDLCAGRTDLIQSARLINAAEEAQCEANGLQVQSPVILGYATAVLVTRNGSDIGGDCLTLGGVKSLLSVGSSVTNWRQIGFSDQTFGAATPPVPTAVMQAIGHLALGFPIGGLQRPNLRTDLQTFADQGEIGSFIAGADRVIALDRDTRAYERRVAAQRQSGDAAAIDRAEAAAAKRVVAKIEAENRRRQARNETVADPAALEAANAKRVSRAKRTAGDAQRRASARVVARAGAAYRRSHLADALADGRLGVVSYPYSEAHSDVLRPLEIDPRKRAAAGSRPECRFPSQQTIAGGSYPLALPIYLYGDRRTLRGPTARPLVRELLDRNTVLARENDIAGLSAAALATTRRTLGLASSATDDTGSASTTSTPAPATSGIPGVDAPQATP